MTSAENALRKISGLIEISLPSASSYGVLKSLVMDIRELAAMGPAPSRHADREEIARAIHPEAFLAGSPDYYGPDETLSWNSAAQRVALKKADAVLALRDAPRNGGDGWKLVPAEATAEMMRAFWLAGPYPEKPFAPGYRAMIAAAPPSNAGDGTQAARDVLAERRRQVEAEGWTPEHDDEHAEAQMAAAAAAYAFSAATVGRYFAADPIGFWPWEPEWFKPTDPRRNLVKAGALILAEIERLDRIPSPNAGDGTQDTQGHGR